MEVRITLIRASDGETAEITDEWEERDSLLFYWSEGNASCDCVRAEEFAIARGEEDPDLSCGDGAFLVRIKVGDEIVYEEARK